MKTPIVETKGLKKYFKVGQGFLHAVDDVDLAIAPEETLGVVGESGCGSPPSAGLFSACCPLPRARSSMTARASLTRGKRKSPTYTARCR